MQVPEEFSGVVRALRRIAWLSFEITRGARSADCQSAVSRIGNPRAVRNSGRVRIFNNCRLPVGATADRLSALQDRALWLHHICRRVLRIFGAKVSISGNAPKSGLLVANHLSYLDILLLSSLTPCVFVAKSEVRAWPIFGWFARMAGTIFVDRSSRLDAARASEAIRAALREGVLVVLFLEGTSSNGATVLPFKSSLLAGVVGERVPICVAALRYELPDGDARAEVCYWGDHTLVPHLLNLMTKRAVHAAVSFSSVPNTWRNRKKLALQLHAEVDWLHTELRSADCQSALSRIGNPRAARTSSVRRLPGGATADRLSALPTNAAAL